MQMVAGLDQLLQNQAMPLLKCTFVSEMFADLFIPLCVDAFGGFSLIGAANVSIHPPPLPLQHIMTPWDTAE